MKRSKIYGTGAGLLLAGAVVLGTGMFALGGRPGFYIDITGVHLDGAEGAGITLKKSSLDEFTSAKIKLDYCDFHIIPSDEFAIEGQLAGRRGKPVIEVEDGELILKEQAGKGVGAHFLSFGFSEFEESYMNLYVPKEVILEQVEIDSDAGDISAENLAAERLRIHAAYGDVELQDAEIDSAKVYLEAGNLEADRLLVTELEAQNAYGDVEISLQEDADEYSMDLKNEYGSIEAPSGGNLLEEDGQSVYQVKRSGDKSLQVFCEAGNIAIR